jgi:Predicted hydrolases or acyltransferases (alpha/beta hydrolase superfamily)
MSYLERPGERYIILLHGLGGYGNNFLKIANLLSDDYGVILPDLLGHGKSEKLHNLTVEDQSKALNDLISTMCINDYIIGGNSYGGWVSQYHEIVYGNASKLILIDSAGTNPTVGQNGQESMNRFLKRIEKAYPNNDMEVIKNILINNTDSQFAITDEMLRKITKPTLIIWGDRDSLIPVKYAEHIHELITSSTLEIIEGAGHTPHFEAFEKVALLINDFLHRE